MDGAMGEPTKAPCLQRGACSLNGNVEAILMAGRDEHALLLGAADNLVGVRHGHGHGLLDDDVHPGVDTVKRNGSVLAALRGDGDELELWMLRKYQAVVRKARNGGVVLETVLGENRLHVLGDNVTHGDDVKLVADRRGNVVGRDTTAADKSVLETHTYSTSMLSRAVTFFIAFLVSKTILACSCTMS